MKRILISIAAVLATFILSAKEISTNPSTGMTLSENIGVYTITGKSGAIVLGNKEAAGKFLVSANAAFTTEAINHVFNFGGDEFEVNKDDEGMYIIKVGLGAVKLRPSDTLLFSTALGIKTVGNGVKQVTNFIKKNVKELSK